MQTKKQGFTLIELLVVIVIIGILATIAIPQFTGYFKKARDSERKGAVSNIATILMVDQAALDSPDYTTVDTTAEIDTVLAKQGYAVPAAKNGYSYYVLATASELAIATCLEENGGVGKPFAAGTSTAKTAVEGATCANKAVPDTNIDSTAGSETAKKLSVN